MRTKIFSLTGCLTFLLFFFIQHSVISQNQEKRPATPIICPAKFQDMNTRVNLPKVDSDAFQRSMQRVATAQFEITFGPGAQANPDAQAAFRFALDIWATQIVSSVPIKIFADFANLGAGVLASAGPAYNVINFTNAPEPNTLYPAALANALSGEILFPDEPFDLVVNLGNGIPWYFGTDGNTPAGLFDFVTVALHEAGHGLGFTTTRSFNSTTGVGSLRSNGNPSIFGVFIEDGPGTPLLSLPDPSVQLGNAFTGGDIFINGAFSVAALNGQRPELYAPSNFQGGSSIAHWDEVVFPAGDPNSLMTPQVGSAESNFDIGDITRGFFKDMGWVINDAGAPSIVASPSSLSEELFVGNSVTKTISISNISDNFINASVSTNAGNTTIESTIPNQLAIASAGAESFDVTINTTGLAKGIYNDTLFVTAVETADILSIPVAVRVLDGTETPTISVSPLTYNESVEQLNIVTRDLLIENSGDDDLRYSISINDNSLPNFNTRVQTSTSTIKSQGFTNLQFSSSGNSNTKSSLVKNSANNYNKLVTSLYATNFEEFSLGDINSQQGWVSQFLDNWVIADTNPFDGSQHFSGISDGLGGTRPANILAISPTVTPGNDPFMVLSAKVNIQGTGVTWEVIPQSPTAGSVVTRLRFNPDSTIDVLAGAGFNRIETTVPSGYFDLRIVVDKADSSFTIFFDGQNIFSGIGFAPEIEQVVFLSNMEVAGSAIDIDNLEITDGDSEAFFLSVSPITGIVPFGSSSTAQVKFDTRILDPGQYSATISINSNDTTNSSLDIPVSLTVSVPPTIEVNKDSLNAVVNVQIDIPPVKTETFSISNSGENPLEFTSSLGAINFIPSNATNVPLASLNMSNYGEGNAGTYQEKLAGITKDKIINKEYLTNAITATDSIFYDSGLDFPDDFAGVQTAAYTSALKFDVTSNFTLNAVRNGYRTEAVTDPTVILEIYRGGATPNDGELLSTQTFTQASADGIVVAEVLNEALSFSAGESFWVVHKYPDGIAFPQGVDSNATQRPNTYFFSSDGGATYNPSGFVFFVRALSGGSDNYITLEPSSGTVNPAQSLDVTVNFNGETLANGTYNTDILLASNDPVTPIAQVGTRFDVSGQVSEIAVSDELLLFNTNFLGASKELALTISNNGLAQLNLTNIASDNADFTTNISSGVVPPGGNLEVTISFTPSALGSINGIISIESDASNTNLSEVIVNGVGVDPPIAVLDPTEAFETVDARNTVDSQILLKNDGNSPLTFSFPDLAVAAALAKPDVKLNNTERIEFKGYKINQEKGSNDARVGSPVLYSVGTDNGFGYSWIDNDEPGGPVYNFADISTTGTEITLDLGDDGSTNVPLSFPFEFYGNTYTSLFVNGNGLIAFEQPAASTVTNRQIPTAGGVDNFIAGIWDDLNATIFNGAVHFQDFGDRFIVQWTQVNEFAGIEGQTVTFQIVLYPDGNIDIFYEDVDTAPFRNEATVGIENDEGTDGAQVAFNTTYIKNGLALRFVRPLKPLTNLISNVSPISGVVGAGRSKNLNVTLDATSLNDGVYYDELSVSSNDPVNTPKTLFELTVIGFPEIAVTPDTLNFDPIFVGLSSRASILIENTGTKALEIASISNANSNFIVDVSGPISLEPSASQIVFVDFTPTVVGPIEDVIAISSNDAFGNQNFTIPLSGVGVDPPIIEVTPDLFNFTLIKGDSISESVKIENEGASPLNYSLSTPFFVKAGEQSLTKVQYPAFEYAKIESKEATDTRVGPKFLNASGGPGTFGYTWVDNNSGGPAYDFIDISTTGQQANVGGDGNETVPLPFEFSFFGEIENNITISANGYLTFATITGSDFVNQQIPNTGNPNLFIAGLWDDLEPQNGTGVFYQGTPEYFIVQYENVPGFGFPPFLPIPDPVTFQIILFPDGSIKVQYKNVDSTIRTSSTVGLEGPQGLSGLQVIFNTEFLTNELAITFTPPITGVIQPGEDVEIPIDIATSNLEPEQTYTGDITIDSNDPITPEVKIPVSLELLKGPEVVSFTLIDAFTNQEIGVLNEGDRIDLDDYSMNAFSIVANTGTTEVRSVVFDFNELQPFRTDNRPPFALKRDKDGQFNPVTFPIGINTVTATPYTERRGEGIAGEPVTISFEVFRTNTTEVLSFTLIDVNTNQEVGQLNEGDVINLGDFNDNRFSVIANVGTISVGSVVFDFNGEAPFRIDNRAPFALNGDYRFRRQQMFYPVAFNIGSNTITATPYFRRNGRGEPGRALSINFEVVEGIGSTITLESNANNSTSNGNQFISDISIKPNPVLNYAQLSLKTKHVKLVGYLHDLSGRIVYKTDFEINNDFANQQLDMTGLQKGLYVLSIKDNLGKTLSKIKIIKE